MRSMKPIANVLSSLLLCASAFGCIDAEFILTDGAFTPNPAAAAPTVFLDRRPAEPYQAVGLISIRAPDDTDLSEIMAAAVEKGREVGCDVIVDRTIHTVAFGLPSDLPRWSVVLEGPLRGEPRGPEAATPLSSRRSRPGSPSSAPLMAAPMHYSPPVYVQKAPSTRREFICGVYASRGLAMQSFQPAAGGASASSGSGGLSGFARTSPLRMPLDAERRATSEPPKGGGGFSFSASPSASEESCTGAKLPWRAVGEGIATCDGVIASVGVEAKSLLRFCNGGLCALEIIGKPDGVRKAQWQPRFASLRQALETKYGPVTYVTGREPPDCAASLDVCTVSGVHAHSIGWAWPSGEQVELTVEVTATIAEETRSYSALFFIDYLPRPLQPPAQASPPKAPANQPPAGL